MPLALNFAIGATEYDRNYMYVSNVRFSIVEPDRNTGSIECIMQGLCRNGY